VSIVEGLLEVPELQALLLGRLADVLAVAGVDASGLALPIVFDVCPDLLLRNGPQSLAL
jgi:hypothetical protein